MAKVSLKHIYKVYPNGVKAVNDFNMDIEDKEFIVFVGPSGCGKSTTLRMIAGLEDITAGELRIGDEVVNDMEPKDRDIAMVFQNYALYPHMTVYENMAFGLKIRKVPKDEIHRRIMEAAEILSITEYLDRKPKAMSGGQRQRVALGRAILRNPKVFLLDEPLSNLDAKLRTQMRSEIAKLHEKLQTTFIYVTHDQVEAMTMGSRIVVMKNGVVQQIEKPKDLYRYPINKFVAGFIGTPQMNFFEATLTPEGDKVRINFLNTTNEIVVSDQYFLKVKPEYIDGQKVVLVGLRCENISFDEEEIAKSDAILNIKISHLEELGTETLVYGDLNMDGDGFSETSTRVIVKASGEEEFVKGEVKRAAFDLKRMHIFDKETEESVLPRLPREMALPCTVSDNILSFAGYSMDLPSAMYTEDCEGKVIIPVDAITLDGSILVKVVKVEEVNGKYLNYLKLNNRYLFIITDDALPLNKELTISIDPKRMKIVTPTNDVIVDSLSLVNNLPAKFIRAKEDQVVEGKNGKTKIKHVYNFKFNVEGVVYACPDEIAKKVISALDTKCFDTTYTVDVTPYDLVASDEGIPAEVCGVLDYGKERFIKIMINGNNYVLRSDEELDGNIHVAVDMAKAGVTETKINMKIV